MPGRPQVKFEFNLNNIDACFEELSSLCSNASTKVKVQSLSSKLSDLFRSNKEKTTQTEERNEDEVLDDVLKLPDDEREWIFRNIWNNINSTKKCNYIFDFFSSLNLDEQCDLFRLFGKTMNHTVLELSEKLRYKTKEFCFQDLSSVSKNTFLDQCDQRILSFIDGLTEKSNKYNKYQHDIFNEKFNIYDNLLKARNHNYVSDVSMREGIIAFISSSKSFDTTTVFSKQGGKGTKHVLNRIIRNTYEKNHFTPPDNITTFYSFDNIQTLLQSQRITGKGQEIALAVVVTSILCTLPDGWRENKIQYKPYLSPSFFFSDYQYHTQNKTSIDKLDNSLLLECATVKEEDEKVVEKFFDKDLETAISFVASELDPDTLKDTIDLQVKENVRKTKRLCMNKNTPHINENLKNRKYCNRTDCRQPLKEYVENDIPRTVSHKADTPISASEKRSKHYMDVENIDTGYKVKEMTVGAIEVNPNTTARIVKVLQDILKKAKLTKPSVKVVLEKDKIQKELVGESDSRAWICVTADGLPFKQMIKIVREYHYCHDCEKQFQFITELKTHMDETGHKQYYQTFGNILIQSGHFHYCQTLLRSYIKLNWDLDIEDLSASIGLDSMKAKFMVSKVTNFRKVWDVVRSVRLSRMREMVLAYVKWGKLNHFPLSVKDYYAWKDVYVKSETFNAVFELEKWYGTSLILYISAMRSNNDNVLQSAKKVISPLLHLNGNFNYSVIDVYTDYQDKKLEICAKPLHEYIKTRKFTNKTGLPYCYSPHDERHEEYNKRGLNFQKARNVQTFKENFSVCDQYKEMKDNCFKDDYNIKNQDNHIPETPNYEDNIRLMRTVMRTKKYLSEPAKSSGLLALNENEMDKGILKVTDLAKETKKENVFSIIKSNDFFCGFKKKNFEIFGKNKIDVDYNEQIKIFIGSLEDNEQKLSLYEYWLKVKDQSDFNAEKFVENLIERKFDYMN